MERLNADVGSVKPALQERPEILKSVGVNLPVHIGDRVIDDLVGVLLFQPPIGEQFIGVDVRSLADMFLTMG